MRGNSNAKPNRASVVLAVSLAVGMLLAAMLTGAGAYDNDQWFILENGKWIIENGFPRTDPFHVWGGSIVIENWLWSVLMCSAWGATDGAVGPAIVVWLTGGCMAFLAWKISKLVSPSPIAAAASALFAICLMAGSQNMNMRPSIASLTMTMLALLLVMLHAKTGHTRWLVLVPVVMLVSFNLHMSMAWLVVLVPGVLMLVRVVTTTACNKNLTATMKLVRQYALITIASIAATFVNPYGANGVLFLFRSAGIAGYRDGIFELKPLVPLSDDGNSYYYVTAIFSYACIAVLCFAMLASVLARPRSKIAAAGKQGLQTDHALAVVRSRLEMDAWFAGVGLFTAGMVATMIVAIRLNVIMTFAAPLLFPTVSLTVSRRSEERRGRAAMRHRIAAAVMTLTAIVLPSVVAPLKTPVWQWEQYVDMLDTTQAFDELEKAGAQPGDKVWTDGNYGSYLVWNGYQVSHDMRPELIETALNGEPGHHYYDYMDAQYFDDHRALSRIIDDGLDAGCDWWVVDDGKPVGKTLAGDNRFQKVGAVDDYGVSVYRTVD